MEWNGTLNVSFPFPPESTKNRGRFRKAVHEVLRGIDFWLIGEVKVSWVLFLDEEQRRRTDRYADCDNYVKTLNDAIKGPEGIIIDDTQIQALHVSWVDAHDSEYFELTIEGRPDEVMHGVTGLYEMPDGLFYPANEAAQYFLPAVDRVMRDADELLRRIDPESKLSRAEKWNLRKFIDPGALGYHKSRIIDSGFPVYELEEWRLMFADNIRRLRESVVGQGLRWDEYETSGRPPVGCVESAPGVHVVKGGSPRPQTAQERIAANGSV